jgi:hypothetical protein
MQAGMWISDNKDKIYPKSHLPNQQSINNESTK